MRELATFEVNGYRSRLNVGDGLGFCLFGSRNTLFTGEQRTSNWKGLGAQTGAGGTYTTTAADGNFAGLSFAPSTISNASRIGNTVTITTSAAHNLSVGNSVTIVGVTDPGFNGTFKILTTPTSTTFTYAQQSFDGSSSGGAAYVAGQGSIVSTIARAILFNGIGRLMLNGALTALNATTALQILLYKNGAYDTANPFLVGLSQPSAVVIRAHPVDTSTFMSGVYSMVIWKIRSATGGRSRKSLMSNVLAVTGTTIIADFSATDTANGQDRYGIGVTASGFGGIGPFYKLLEVTDAQLRRFATVNTTAGSPNIHSNVANYFTAADQGKYITIPNAGINVGGNPFLSGTAPYVNTAKILSVTDAQNAVLEVNATITQGGTGISYFNSYEFSWGDGDIIGQPLAPLDDFQPPAAPFAAAIEDSVAVIGAYGDVATGATAAAPGTVVVVSSRTLIESFPPDNLLFLPEPPVGVISRASDGFAFIGCPNNMLALFYTGGKPPMSLQSLWVNTGILSPNGMTLGEGGRLYAMTGQLGLCRIGEQGKPDNSFARKIAADMETWTVREDVVLGWDPSFQFVLVGYHQMLYAYNTQIDEWCTPLDCSSFLGTRNIASIASTRDGARISAVDATLGSPVVIFNFNGGTGTLMKIFLPQFVMPKSGKISKIEPFFRAAAAGGQINVKVYTDTNGGFPPATDTPIINTPLNIQATGLQVIRGFRPRIKNVKIWQLYLDLLGGSGEYGIDKVVVHGALRGEDF